MRRRGVEIIRINTTSTFEQVNKLLKAEHSGSVGRVLDSGSNGW